jgi:hypothetical protein
MIPHPPLSSGEREGRINAAAEGGSTKTSRRVRKKPPIRARTNKSVETPRILPFYPAEFAENRPMSGMKASPSHGQEWIQ